MRVPPFALERYFAQHEFSAKYLLSSSDCEAWSQNELLTMADSATRALWNDLRLGYTESSGHPLLRREIANTYKTVWPDDVVVLTPEEGVFITMNALLEPGDHVIVLSPCYQSLFQVATNIGAEVTEWCLETNGIRWSLDLAFLERNIRRNTRLIVINFPNNPTGFHPDRKTFDSILAVAREKKIQIFSDEMYRYSEYHVEDRLPSACDEYEKAITLGGLSKSFGLPGLRIGWLATKDRPTVNKLAMLKDYTTICSSAPSEILAVMALRARDRILDRTVRILEDNINLADHFFAKHHRMFEWIRPAASPVAFPRLKYPEPIERFCSRLIEKKSVMLVPGSLFNYAGNHFRVGLGRKNFGEALGVLDEHLSDYHVPPHSTES